MTEARLVYTKRILPLNLMTLPLSPALAEQTEETAVASELGDALIHFQQGVDFYNGGRYEQAAIEFARAYELKPSYKIRFNIAQAENMLEQYASALAAYTAYLAGAGEALSEERRTVVGTEIARLVHEVGSLELW